MGRIHTLKTWLNRILSAVCAFLLSFMSFLTCYQVFMRYVMRNPSTMSEDILSYSFVWVSLIATALVFGERDHMNLTFFLEKGSKGIQFLLKAFSEVLILVISIVIFLFGGLRFMSVGALQVSPTLGITMNLVYSILPVCGILTSMYSIINLAELFQDYTGERRSDRS